MIFKKPTIYLTDLNNSLKGKPYPLNVSYIASYLLSQQESLEIKLFKDPKILCSQIEQSPPDILGMSNFSWNAQLNLAVSRWAKSINPNLFIVYGGLDLTINDTVSVQSFFNNNPGVNAYIFFNSEEVMEYLVRKLLDHNFDLKKMVESEELPDGLILNVDGQIVRGSTKMFEFQKDLDYIPSPYLTGLLDEFIHHEDLFPIFETVRGCPYLCTFCCWGSRTRNKLSTFSQERVIAELEYIYKSKPSNKFLYCADGNFGILKRDIEIAHYLRKMYDTTGSPDPIFLYLAKNNTDNIIEISKILSPIFQVNIARQSENDSVLKNIKRKNISQEAFEKIHQTLKKDNINNQIEVIFPLPGETLDSFYNGLKKIMDSVDPSKVEIRLYPLFLLRGAEMSEPEYRKEFQLKTALRRSANSGFRYQDKKGKEIDSIEVDEIVISTSTFSFEDFLNVRVFHLFLCVFQTYKIYAYILKYIQDKHGINPITFLQRLVSQIMQMPAEQYPLLKNMMDEFIFDINNEFIVIEDSYNQDEIIKQLKMKKYKRLNIFYIFRLLYGKGIRDDFYNFLIDNVLQDYMKKEEALNLIKYMDSFVIDFNSYSPHEVKVLTDPSTGKTEEVHLNVRDVVNDYWNKVKDKDTDLEDILEQLYVCTYPGYLFKVLLFNTDVKDVATKDLVYTLH